MNNQITELRVQKRKLMAEFGTLNFKNPDHKQRMDELKKEMHDIDATLRMFATALGDRSQTPRIILHKQGNEGAAQKGI